MQTIDEGYYYVNSKRYSSFDESGYQFRLSGDVLIASPAFSHKLIQSNPLSSRNSIESFSKGSRGRMQRYLRESEAEYSVFITLTYPHGLGRDGVRCKRDLRCFGQRFLRYTRHSVGGCPPSMFWFMEFTKSGCLHYHLLVNRWLPKNLVSSWWYAIVGSEDARHLSAGTRVEAVRGGRRGYRAYAAKYARKLDQKVVPEDFGFSGRFWGVIGHRETVVADVFVSVNASKCLGVRDALASLVSGIQDAIFEGNARRLYADKGYNTRVVVVRSDASLMLIRDLLTNLEREISKNIENISYIGAPELGFQD